MAKAEFYFSTGKRKTSVARVKLTFGDGTILINNVPLRDYFRGIERFQSEVNEPLLVTKSTNKYNVTVNVKGGGIKGQAEAIRHGIARALAQIDDKMKKVLRQKGLLTRDPRMVERKKPGRPKARKSFQFSKR